MANSVAAQSADTAMVSAGENVTLSWTAVIGQSYVVQYKDGLESNERSKFQMAEPSVSIA